MGSRVSVFVRFEHVSGNSGERLRTPLFWSCEGTYDCNFQGLFATGFGRRCAPSQGNVGAQLYDLEAWKQAEKRLGALRLRNANQSIQEARYRFTP